MMRSPSETMIRDGTRLTIASRLILAVDTLIPAIRIALQCPRTIPPHTSSVVNGFLRLRKFYDWHFRFTIYYLLFTIYDMSKGI
ncbi:MAG: hypothetical protein CEE38_15160 [Planctomycetes bacterium B3_Pla]|nr:MAG: hypothetical protein CEE38_15160 [Planctomycetes bacterium B3_Pla]